MRAEGAAAGVALAVVGASGGVGASTLVAATAVVAATRGVRVVAVDLQGGGPGLDVVFGVEHEPGLRWPHLVEVDGAVDGAAVLSRLPWGSGVPVLSHARHPGRVPDWGQVTEVVSAIREVADLVVLDVPRGLSLVGAAPAGASDVVPSGLAGVGVTPSDHAVVLARPSIVSLAALTAAGAGVAGQVADTYVMLRGAGAARRVLDDVQDCLDLPALPCLADDPVVERELRRGRPPGLLPGPVAERAADLVAIAVPGWARAVS